MIKIRLLIISCIIFSFALSQSPRNTTAPAKKDNTVNKKYGNWQQDSDGYKYREDYALRDMLRGNELVKYTRINGGQYGGGSSTTKFTLCSDGSLQYYHQSVISVSVDGASGNDGSKEEDTGTWKAMETENGTKFIMVKLTKNNAPGFLQVKPMGSKIQMVWYNEWQEFFMKKIGC